MQFKTIAINALLVGASLAQVAVLQTAIKQVQDALGKLDITITGLSDANSAANLLQSSADTKQVMDKATKEITGAQALSLQDALSLQSVQQPLIDAVTKVTDDIAGKTQVLDQIGATQQAIQTLKEQKKTAGALGDAVVSKIPAIGQGIAQQSIGQMTTLIDGAITKLGGNPNQKLTRAARVPVPIAA
ncbi:hypothetical protein GGTG_11698 [Gaeumannomyces tritici R3-111a-1]|uniref:Cell wall protein n=1 Tax=Gaeumannomyces tritici (strain R3-111a-1) TaxID=644352 RepID=J3PDX5_GAET3|nr:hypothetical protein GGTG_11698 [Gaeumannomyces tritici R3-111a-1]EJT70675.1 hypothetical protein GGTG_11698 [Gaeumannomyces tritici R3-111a-1]